MDSTERTSPQSKRHSYPVILTYTETLSVLSEHQREYNRQESIKRSKTPVLGQNGNESDEERRQKLQQALDWLSQELKDMYHQDKFLLRQFNHLNRSIQELKDKREINEESNETKQAQNTREKQDQNKNRKLPKAPDPVAQHEPNTTPPKKETEVIIHGEFKLEDLKQAQIRQALNRQAEQKQQEELSKQKLDDTKQDKRSLNSSEYDSDYGSDQSVDKFEADYLQPQKNVALSKSPKASPKQQRSKRWSWWK